MKTNYLLALGLIMCLNNAASAQTDTPEPKKFRITFSERARMTTVGEASTLDHEKPVNTFTRWRTYLGAEYNPNLHFGMKVELANEARIWITPPAKKTAFNEIFFNQLYVDWNDIANLPIDLRLGRQNIKFDEGFMMVDGNPMVGSRSDYFNAAKATFRFDEKNNLTALFVYNPHRDKLLPVLNEGDHYQPLEEQTNNGAGLYYKGNLHPVDLSAYYFYKKYFKNTTLPEAETHAIGARANLALPGNDFHFISEFAYEFGKVADLDRRAWGGYSRLEYNIGRYLYVLDQLSVGSVYMSGDDPTTPTIEGFDPMWNRWTRWGESYIYTLATETGKISYWSNLASINAGLKATLAPNVRLDANYMHLFAMQLNPASPFTSGGGKTRGDLYYARVSYQINPHWSGHLHFEHFNPGNYYFNGADNYNWVRFELMYKL